MGDLVAVQALMGKYCFATDEHDLATVKSCFAKKAELFGVHGPDKIGEKFQELYAGQRYKRRHMLSNMFFFEEHDTQCVAVAYEHFYLIRDEKVDISLTGIYRITVVLEEGQWKIQSFRAIFDVPYDPGDSTRIEAGVPMPLNEAPECAEGV
jgi:hypothetical protein